MVTWGPGDHGGFAHASSGQSWNSAVRTFGDPNGNGVASLLDPAENGGLKIVEVLGNVASFAAIRDDGSVVSWGSATGGGDSSAWGGSATLSQSGYFSPPDSDGDGVGDLLQPAKNGQIKATKLYATLGAFGVLRDNASFVSWGIAQSGGLAFYSDLKPEYSGLFDLNQDLVADLLSSEEGVSKVSQIYPGHSSFQILKESGVLLSIGNHEIGGRSLGVFKADADVIYHSALAPGSETRVADLLNPSVNVGGVKVVSALAAPVTAAAAIRSDGSVVTWGNPFYGGASVGPVQSGNVDFVKAFADTNGDEIADVLGPRSDGVKPVKLFANGFGTLAALFNDGGVVLWGNKVGGASVLQTALSTPISTETLSGDVNGNRRADVLDPSTSGKKVVDVAESLRGFLFLFDDGSVTSVGHSSYEGMMVKVQTGIVDYRRAVLSRVTESVSPPLSEIESRMPKALIPRLGGLPAKAIFGRRDSSSFVVLRADGSLLTFGRSDSGGETRWSGYSAAACIGFGSCNYLGFSDTDANDIADVFQVNKNGGVPVQQVFKGPIASAAVRSDGKLFLWGTVNKGGDPTGKSRSYILQNAPGSLPVTLPDANQDGVADLLESL